MVVENIEKREMEKEKGKKGKKDYPSQESSLNLVIFGDKNSFGEL